VCAAPLLLAVEIQKQVKQLPHPHPFGVVRQFNLLGNLRHLLT
jgi:hypothetical protein